MAHHGGQQGIACGSVTPPPHRSASLFLRGVRRAHGARQWEFSGDAGTAADALLGLNAIHWQPLRGRHRMPAKGVPGTEERDRHQGRNDGNHL
jgi:hypothetical protein